MDTTRNHAMPEDLPLIGVMDNKHMKGAANLTDEVEPLHALPIDQAMRHQWTTDAHFVTYWVLEPDGSWGEEIARLRKPVLPQVRRSQGDICTLAFVFDWDNPDHAAWSEIEDTFDMRLAKLARISDEWPTAWKWSACYTTKHGCRIVYVLDEAVPVDMAEGMIRWMCQKFISLGIRVDVLTDWTRCFRLPSVLREGEKTWQQDYYEFYEQWEERLPVDEIGTLGKTDVNEYAEITPVDDPKPDAYECKQFLNALNDKGNMVMTEWFKAVRKRLRNRECYDALFNNAPIGEQGQRNTKLFAFVGQVISLIMNIEGTTPAHVYALFLDPVEQLEPDEETPDWTAVLWDHVCRLWAQEEAKVRAADEQREKEAEEAIDLEDRILDGMRQWCNNPLLESEDARDYMHGRLIAARGPNFFLMQSNGYFSEMPVSRELLISQIRKSPLRNLISTTKTTADGALRDASPAEVINKHSTVVSAIEAIPQMEGGVIDRLDSSTATLVLPAFRRNAHLSPEWNDDVDEWLQALFDKHYETGVNWLAWALAFDEGPICALSLSGAAGAGKKMLAQGLAETLEKPVYATEKDLVSGYQYGLLQSPFVVVNEGWPTMSTGRHPADEFRARVSGDPIMVDTKFNAPIAVTNPVRILFTANNTEVIQKLTANRNLSPDDRDALGVRLLHLNIGRRASDFLRSKGGTRFTHGWIRGDGGTDSEFVVARHLLWLYKNRQGPTGTRFLVEGNKHQEVMFEMRTQSGSAPLVIECLIRMMNAPSAATIKGLTIENNKLYVLSSEVLDYFRKHLGTSTKERLTANIIAQVFKGLVAEDHEHPFVLESRAAEGRRRWYEIDAELLLACARRDGWRCERLETLVQQQRAERKSIEKIKVETSGIR